MGNWHSIVYSILRPPVILMLRLKFGYTYETAKNLPDNYIVLSNHVTDYDPLMVAASFPRQMYFVASEHISRWGFTSKLIHFLVAPILRKKGMSAASAILDVLRKLKKGNNVCMFAEGVRTWDGITCPISPTTGQMVKRAGCGLVTYKILGGYFLSPAWSKRMRRGWAKGAVTAVYTKEELAEMSAEEINTVIARDLYEDAYRRQMENPRPYPGKGLAEGLENMLPFCPCCEGEAVLASSGNTVRCKNCGYQLEIDRFGMLTEKYPENAKAPEPFHTVSDLMKHLNAKIDEGIRAGTLCSCAKDVKLFRIEDRVSLPVTEGECRLDMNKFTCGDFSAPLTSINDFAFHGKRALVFSVGKEYYEAILPETASVLRFKRQYDRLKAEREE